MLHRPKGFGIVVSIGLGVSAVAAVSVSRASPSEHNNPIPADPGSLAQGRRLYLAHCTQCHGERGKGDGKSSADLGKDVPDLTDPAVAVLSDGKLFQWISRGRKPMPGFEKELAEQDRWHVINYVRSLSKRN